jgi:phosphohistidine swiveling domain-containing protein
LIVTSHFTLSTAPLSTTDTASLLGRSNEFVLGSTNVDEDLHFSTLYLESTLSPPSSRWHTERWYSELLAVNRHAVERYYLRRDECEAVSEELSHQVFAQPQLLISLLYEIERRAGLLDSAFPFGWLGSAGDGYNLEDLTELYRRHLALHQYLYEVSRLPDALDRGTGLFTRRLREILAGKASDRDLPPDALAILSAVERPSIFREEQLEFVELTLALSATEQAAVRAARTGALAMMVLSPTVRVRLQAHRDKWAPLFYHGYGSREQVALIELAARMRQVLRKGSARVIPDAPTKQARDRLATEIGLDAREALCFYGYGLLGWTKARRRWFQLRNFQRLDLLIERLSHELSCPEWDLRVLHPTELLQWLESGQRPGDVIAARYDGAILWFADEVLRITAIPDGFALNAVDAQPESLHRGDGIVGGRVAGRCMLGSRGGHPPADEDLEGPTILVVSQLDSDLVWMLPFYDGLIVEETGASAHAAIIARDIGIPTVGGITDATRLFDIGDVVIVDGDQGTVSRDVADPPS